MEQLLKVNGILPVYLGTSPDFSPYAIPEDFAYFLDGEGWKLFKRNGISVSIHKIAILSGCHVHKEAIHFTGAKIPMGLIQQVTAFFKEVYRKYKSEASGYLFYKDKQWEFVVPDQTVTGSSVKYGEAPQKPGWACAGTIHSHANMTAFHSGTDDNDEADFDGVHITVGKVNTFPEFSCSIVVQGLRGMIDPSLLIAGMETAEVPKDWLDAIKDDPPATTTYFGGVDAFESKRRAERRSDMSKGWNDKDAKGWTEEDYMAYHGIDIKDITDAKEAAAQEAAEDAYWEKMAEEYDTGLVSDTPPRTYQEAWPRGR